MRKMWSSSKASWSTAFSSRALSRSRPKGFSTTTRPRRFNPTAASDPMISWKALGGMAR